VLCRVVAMASPAKQKAQPIEIRISLDLDDEDRAALDEIVGMWRNSSGFDTAATRDAALGEFLSRVARAGTTEYLSQLTQGSGPATITQHRELRLSHVLEHVFGESLPSEHVVAEMFGLTASEARSILPRAVSRHRKRLDPIVAKSARTALEAALGKEGDDDRSISCDATTHRYLVDRVSRLAGSRGGSFQSPTKRNDAVGKYTISDVTLKQLCTDLGAKYPKGSKS